MRQELIRRGHRLVEANGLMYGGYEAIRRDLATGIHFGATESRRDGVAAGSWWLRDARGKKVRR